MFHTDFRKGSLWLFGSRHWSMCFMSVLRRPGDPCGFVDPDWRRRWSMCFMSVHRRRWLRLRQALPSSPMFAFVVCEEWGRRVRRHRRRAEAHEDPPEFICPLKSPNRNRRPFRVVTSNSFLPLFDLWGIAGSREAYLHRHSPAMLSICFAFHVCERHQETITTRP
jgi:hypothetical protein